MKQKIATIDIWVDKDATQTPSSCLPNDTTDHFDIEMHPNYVKRPVKNVVEAQTLLAHELGHAIAYITNDSSHNPVVITIANELGSGQLKVPAERKANEIAHQMGIELDENRLAAGLATYEESPW